MHYAAGCLLDVYVFITLSLNIVFPLLTYTRVFCLADLQGNYYR